jgi:hypothetical protein
MELDATCKLLDFGSIIDHVAVASIVGERDDTK